MKILFDGRSAFHGMGGIGRYTWSLLKEFAALDRDDDFLCTFTHLSPPEPISLPGNFRVRLFEAGMVDERFDQLVMPGLLKREKIDLYHNPTFAVPLIRTGTKTIATIHDVVFRRHAELVEPRLRDYLDTATRRACKLADQLITVSEFSKREIVELYGVDPAKIEVIPNGVHAPPAEVKGSVAKFGLTPGRYVLYVGSIEKKKNLELLVDGFARLKATDLTLALAGSGRVEAGPKNVRPLGYVAPDDLELLYANALVFVYPSLYEGFGLPPLEAMARGVPTIVARTSALPEVVGDGAELVDPHDVGALAETILALEGDPARRESLAARGRDRARDFTWKRSAERHLELYRKVMSPHANPASCV